MLDAITNMNDIKARQFFAHASSLTPDSFLFTDDAESEWFNARVDSDELEDFYNQMVEESAKLSIHSCSSYDKRKAFYQVTDSGDGPIAYEGVISENWSEQA